MNTKKYKDSRCLECGIVLAKRKSKRCKKHFSLSLEWRNNLSKSMKGKIAYIPTVEQKQKRSILYKGKYSGSKHPGWIEDRSLLKKDRQKMYDTKYKYWAKSVKDRDNWKCRIADNNCGGRLEAHHILGWQSHPELRYQLNNDITLCHTHHPRKRIDEAKLSPFFQSLVAERQ